MHLLCTGNCAKYFIFIYSFKQMRTRSFYDMPGTIPGPGDKAVNKT